MIDVSGLKWARRKKNWAVLTIPAIVRKDETETGIP